MRKLSIASLFLLVLFGAGCASNVRQTVAVPTSVGDGKAQDVQLVISGQPLAMSERGYEQTAEELRAAIVANINAASPGTRINSGASSNSTRGLRADVVIHEFRYVSGAARFLTGIMSGNARLTVRVQLTDLETGQKIGESDFGTSSSMGHGILGATTGRQVEAVAKSVANMIVGR